MAAAQVTKVPATDEVRQLLARSAEASPWAPLAGINDSTGGASVWLAELEGRRALIATRGMVMEHGRLLEVVSCRSLGDRMRAEDVAAVAGRIAREFYDDVDMVAMCTRHEHLVRCCERAGWTRTGFIVTQRLKVH